jgi:hypothetical protein
LLIARTRVTNAGVAAPRRHEAQRFPLSTAGSSPLRRRLSFLLQRSSFKDILPISSYFLQFDPSFVMGSTGGDEKSRLIVSDLP